jgi:predicted cupin superfamily sugar epimerase
VTASGRAQELIDLLGLATHPERGFFVQTFRARLSVPQALAKVSSSFS